ncbi:hypothetical protein L4C36_22345 [Photobacterium japonica]|uniref:hypothetical protein n=1 Tax=Photobacterium japonica TaxID=2910235 RepID=UPI003D1164BB
MPFVSFNIKLRRNFTMRVVLLAMLTILPSFCFAETISDGDFAKIKASTDKIVAATISLDFKTVVDHMPQNLIDMAGGKDKLIQMSAESFLKLESNGLKISEFTYNMPKEKTVTSLNNIVLIPTKMVITSDAVTMKSNSYLIAFQAKGHDEWKFVDASGIKNRKSMEFLFPAYPKDKQIPQATNQFVEP